MVTMTPAFTIQDTTPARVRRSAGFSLLEILVAVGLLAVIIVGLMAMFNQTEKAFRLGTRQVDILESGRAVMELLVRELQEATAVPDQLTINFFATNAFPAFVQRRPPRDLTNHLQEYFFVLRSNDTWSGIGYLVDAPPGGGVGTLYRYETNSPSLPRWAVTNLFFTYQQTVANFSAANTNFSRVANNIIHLRVLPYNRDGILYTNAENLLLYWFPNQWDAEPAAVDLELGILEPRAYERYKALVDLEPTNPLMASAYLVGRADKVHVFRQRIPIRTSQ